MSRDTPSADKSAKERGLHAEHGDDPTLASYLSSLLYLFSFPGLLVLSYAGHWQGLYGEPDIIPVFGGLLVAGIVVVFTVMHFATNGR